MALTKQPTYLCLFYSDFDYTYIGKPAHSGRSKREQARHRGRGREGTTHVRFTRYPSLFLLCLVFSLLENRDLAVGGLLRGACVFRDVVRTNAGQASTGRRGRLRASMTPFPPEECGLRMERGLQQRAWGSCSCTTRLAHHLDLDLASLSPTRNLDGPSWIHYSCPPFPSLQRL